MNEYEALEDYLRKQLLTLEEPAGRIAAKHFVAGWRVARKELALYLREAIAATPPTAVESTVRDILDEEVGDRDEN